MYTIFYVKVIVIVLSITHVSKATMLMYAFFVMLFQYCILISKYLNFNGVFLNKTSFLVYCRLSLVVVALHPKCVSSPNAFGYVETRLGISNPQMHLVSSEMHLATKRNAFGDIISQRPTEGAAASSQWPRPCLLL